VIGRTVAGALLVVGLLGGQQPGPNTVLIPGGIKALAFIARGKENPPPDRFLVDYCQAVLHHTAAGDRAIAQTYLERLERYFQRIAALESLGTRSRDRLEITLGGSGAGSRGRTEKVANFLGWRTYSSNNQLVLEVLDRTQQSARKETATALDIDELAMQEALQAGRPFTFEVPYDRADVLLDEGTWRRSFAGKEELPGGLAQALARDPRLARLYVGLSELDEQTLAALLAAFDLRRLTDGYADLLYRNASALAVAGGRVVVPGGEAAEPIWRELAGASPREPARFLRALLDADKGRLFSFFSTLSRVSAERQRFATRSAARARRLYELWPRAGAASESSVAEFLRSVPLEADGRIRFPGGHAAWIPEEAKRINGALKPEQEDDLVAALTKADSQGASRRLGLAAFPLVARLEARRMERGGRPLDALSARLLALNARRTSAFYPRFEELTGLTQQEFVAFFELAAKLQRRNGPELNMQMGQFDSLTALIGLGRQSGALTERQRTELFRFLCERFAIADSAADLTGASLGALRRILQEAGSQATGATADERIRNQVLGRAAAVVLTINGVEREVDVSAIRHSSYRQVLELQSVPAVETLLGIHDAAQNLAAGKGVAAKNVRLVQAGVAALPDPEIPESLRGRAPQNHNLRLHRAEPLRRAATDLERAASRSGNRGAVEEAARELLAALSPQVKLALSGILYAYYLNPNDLLISEDPLLLRKHQFVDMFSIRTGTHVFPAPSLQNDSGALGSYLTGGFAGFGPTAGQVALAGSKQTESPSEMVFAAQVGSLRAGGHRVTDEGLRAAAARLRAAKEWVAGARPEEVAAATRGLLPPSRQAHLLSAVGAKNWNAAWKAATPGDLYWLAGAAGEPRGDWLLERPEAAFEEYEHHLMPQHMGQRAAEFPLHLAEYMDRRKWPAAVWPAVAEPLAQEILRELPMSHMRDWRSVVAAFARIDDTMVERILEKR